MWVKETPVTLIDQLAGSMPQSFRDVHWCGWRKCWISLYKLWMISLYIINHLPLRIICRKCTVYKHIQWFYECHQAVGIRHRPKNLRNCPVFKLVCNNLYEWSICFGQLLEELNCPIFLCFIKSPSNGPPCKWLINEIKQSQLLQCYQWRSSLDSVHDISQNFRFTSLGYATIPL